ncbi:MAG TPA: hypothetical protein VG318_09855 [Actinomycetota bacterium]|nr:hypothetical protein [Actinomycetota bacterium]
MRSSGSSRRGRVVVISGPDGAGKSTLADAIEARLGTSGVRRFHHRPGILPRRSGSDGPVLEPHADPPYPRPVSLAKTIYLFADFLVGWGVLIAPRRRRGAYVIMERGWWDVVVDQRRYRLDVPGWVLRGLGRLLPAPDLHVVLDAPPELIYERKRELSVEEIGRQSAAWRSLARGGRAVVLDASRPVDALAAEVCERLRGDADAEPA